MTLPVSPRRQPHPPFGYDLNTRNELRRTISPERFGTYERLADGDELAAFYLYTLNAALGSAFHGPLQALEVALRNSVHALMTAAEGRAWYDTAPLHETQRAAIRGARQALRRERKPETPGGIIASTNLGFWVGLFAKRYDASLWRPVLHRAFDPTPARRRVHGQLDRVRTLRNRIAHHEPIVQRNLRADYETILWLLDLLSSVKAAWVRHYSRVPDILRASNTTLHRF